MNYYWVAGLAVGFALSTYFAHRGTEGAIQDLRGHDDQVEASARQSRQDIAAIVWLLVFTNALLAGILAALAFR